MNTSVSQKSILLKNIFRILLIIFLAMIVSFLVYKTGGTKSAWPQLYYIIIIIAAYYWQFKGGLLVSFILGLVVGPLMPLDVEQGIMQTLENCIIRILIFMIVGSFSGYIFQKNNEVNSRIIDKTFKSDFSGLYNVQKLFLELKKFIDKKENFCLVFIDIVNLEDISKYVNYSIVKEIIQKGITDIQSRFNENELYAINFNEYCIILKDYKADNIKKRIFNDLKDVLSSIKIEGYSFDLIIKVGIIFSEKARNSNRITGLELLNMAKIAADKGGKFESSVHIYDLDFYKERRLFYEISGSLSDAVKNHELFLVFQPVVSLENRAIISSEVLVRWNRGDRIPVGPETFIKIAEETGMIKQITMEILKQLTSQIKLWDKQNIETKVSFNITAGELIDEQFIECIKKLFDKNDIDRSKMGIEITERVFNADSKKLNDILKILRKKGYIIYLDDFGTGYSSIKNFNEINADIIKIDKYFIDRINNESTKNMMWHIIQWAHEIGSIVIAEGVETKEQVLILDKLGCDRIQGFYFSQPLEPDDFAEYYRSFDIDKYI